ncbi:MAG: hypothetical protein ACFCBW_02585, partial [Candidatus Competibacterales bacterium]
MSASPPWLKPPALEVPPPRGLGRLRLDTVLLLGLVAVPALGLLVLYIASGQSTSAVVRQGVRLGVGFGVMAGFAHLPIPWLKRITPGAYLGGGGLRLAVWVVGRQSKGAPR